MTRLIDSHDTHFVTCVVSSSGFPDVLLTGIGRSSADVCVGSVVRHVLEGGGVGYLGSQSAGTTTTGWWARWVTR